MAIQNRRGQYTDFNPSKMVAGEFAVVQSGDENTSSGKAVYMAFGPGDVQRLVTDDEVSAEVSEQIGTALDGKVDKVEGKGLSTEDYTTADKDEVADLKKGIVDILYGTSTSTGATETKTVSCPNFVLKDGVLIVIRMDYTNTAASPKFNVNNTGAKDVYPTAWPANSTMLFRYNATNNRFEMVQTFTPVTYDGRSATPLSGNLKDLIHYGVCTSGGGSSVKDVDIDGYSLIAGAWIAVKFTNTNSADRPVLSVGSNLMKQIKYRGQNLPSPDYIKAGGTYLFVYDGTYWQIVGDIDTDTSYRATLDSDGIAHL